ncbi:PLP-dependent aminotransferase family protein [Paenibacillus sp. MMS20-IR301]|uniref:MocR-like pyridoxine biosynthesis transcription factor PdxR n=1 Tax=Paenibacillus sp. MMS20-IR301 TaxID=2895946 RepID=UPI0028E576C5|nr:PLP-dependent aminotransferase family protein [Paenibacillus sp. MMS20-IR301]WNS41954.1 PLP-dependent aminotransferase family protein [Paenibacillus sp. MMS20-IR301]
MNEHSETPYYIQLYDYLAKEIISGTLPGGTRLPSIRRLAGLCGISATPVELAYQQLLAEGFIASKPRSGYYVLQIHISGTSAEAAGQTLPAAEPITPRDPRRYPYDFHMSRNDFTTFPHKIWRSLYQEQLTNPDLLQYGDPQGEPALRASIATYLRQFRGLRCTADQVVIGGDQYTLCSLLCLMLKERVTRLAIEDPGYHLLPAAFKRSGYEIKPIPLEEEGLQAGKLYGSGADAVYISPSHQFPRGMAMPVAGRLALLEWARSVSGYIIEDDYDGEFRYHGRPIPALQGLVPDSPVIYMCSFAQSFTPALCIHYMVLPRELLPVYHSLRSELYLEHSASRLHQIALHYFMERGYFEKHLRRIRLLYQRKHDLLVQAVSHYFGDAAALSGQGAGFHLLLTLKQPAAGGAHELAAAAGAAGIRVTPMSYTWWDKPGSNHPEFILGFGGIAGGLIDEGIRRLAEVWLGEAFQAEGK